MFDWLMSETARRTKKQSEYAEQRSAIDAQHERSGADIFVSKFDILKTPTGRAMSYGTWSNEVTRTWLPQTDCIAFTGRRDGKRWSYIVPWDVALGVCTGLLEPVPNLRPRRFETRGWPAPEALEKLRAAAVIVI
jgi:hypothetical protein